MRHCSLALHEGLNGVNRQLSRGLKFNCQPSQKVIFFTANRQKCRLIFTVKKFQGTSNLTVFLRDYGS